MPGIMSQSIIRFRSPYFPPSVPADSDFSAYLFSPRGSSICVRIISVTGAHALLEFKGVLSIRITNGCGERGEYNPELLTSDVGVEWD